MKIKINLICFCLLVNLSITFSQSITQDVVSSGGETYNQINGSVQLNLGETIIETYFQTNSAEVYSGFEQGSYSILVIEENKIIADLEMGLYPNPSNGEFFLRLDRDDLFDFKFQINDQLGKIILFENSLKEKETEFNLSSYDRGIYYLIVNNSKLEYQKTFKLIKY